MAAIVLVLVIALATIFITYNLGYCDGRSDGIRTARLIYDHNFLSSEEKESKEA